MATSIPQWINALNQPPSWALAVLQNPGATADERLQACQILVQSGIVRWTAPHIDALRNVAAVAEQAGQLIELSRRLWDFDLTGGSAIPAAPTADANAGNYWIVPANSSRTILAFTGRARRLSISVYMMQRILEPFGANIIYLFDPKETFYLGGIGGLWNGFDATIGLLRRLCDGLGTQALYCFGQSTGGYGALRYGLELEARAVLAFSPMILHAKRPRALARIGAALGRPVDADEVDLRRLFLARGGAPHATVICGERNRTDMLSAAELADLPNVEHRPLPDVSDHAVITNLLRNGALRALVGELLAR